MFIFQVSSIKVIYFKLVILSPIISQTYFLYASYEIELYGKITKLNTQIFFSFEHTKSFGFAFEGHWILSTKYTLIIVIPTFQRVISAYSLHYKSEPWTLLQMSIHHSEQFVQLYFILFVKDNCLERGSVTDRSCFEVFFCCAFMDVLPISGSAGVNPCFRIYIYRYLIRFVTFVPRHLFV